MAMLGRKRVYAGPTRRYNKKSRRTFKRRRTSRYKGNTSKSGTGSSFGFRAKKLSRKRWNNALWTSTLQRQHIRSNASFSELVNSNTNPNLYAGFLRQCVNNNFWTVGGGAQPFDTTVPVPPISGDVVIRGGQIGIKFINSVEDANPMAVEVFLIKTGDEFDNSLAPTNVPHGWDPTLIPDFSTNIGRVIMRKTFLIENANIGEVKYRLPIQKVDQGVYNSGKNQYFWYILVNNSGAVAAQIRMTFFHNLSFVGDII